MTLAAICSLVFGVCVFIVRQRDMQKFVPVIEQLQRDLPVIQSNMADMRADLSEMKGTLAVVPQLTIRQDHAERDLGRMDERLRALEQRAIRAGG